MIYWILLAYLLIGIYAALHEGHWRVVLLWPVVLIGELYDEWFRGMGW